MAWCLRVREIKIGGEGVRVEEEGGGIGGGGGERVGEKGGGIGGEKGLEKNWKKGRG